MLYNIGMEKYTKYPRTYHLPFSLGSTSDDKMLKSTEQFTDMEVVVTEKMDGENTSMYSDHYHARSLDSKHHASRDMVKSLWATIKHDIPDGWRICGENLYAKHSIGYNDLSSYFLVFSIWNEKNEALSWDDTVEWCNILGLEYVRVLYRDTYDENIIKSLWSPTVHDLMEGYVVRNSQAFSYDDFGKNAAKFVRPKHVTTDTHWMHSEIIANKLKIIEDNT